MARMLAGVALVCAAAAQLPQIGDINFYGLRHITAEQVLQTIHLGPGDPLPASKGDTEDKIAEIPGVASARIQVVCCLENRIALFIGIQEKEQPSIAFHPQPGADAGLPPEWTTAYTEYQSSVARVVGKGTAESDPAVRGLQDRLNVFAAGHLELLRSVLRTSWDAEQRQAAATIIGFAPDKKAVVDDLLFATQDPDDMVRANATRSLAAIALLARKRPALGIHVPASAFVELLNSVVLSDREESTQALLILTEGRGAATLALIRKRAMPALAEMARWKTLSHARPPFLLLGRLTVLPDAQVRQIWEKGDREALIQRAMKPPAARPAAKKRRG